MIMIFVGADPPRIRSRSRQTREDVGLADSDTRVQIRKEGRFLITLGLPTIDGLNRIVTEVPVGPEPVWISPLLGDLQLSDFPDNYSFGSGAVFASVGFKRTLPDGSIKAWLGYISTAVFPVGTQLTDAQIYRMREIMEGLPPGSPDRHTYKLDFASDLALAPAAAGAMLVALQAKVRSALTPYEERWLDIELPILAKRVVI